MMNDRIRDSNDELDVNLLNRTLIKSLKMTCFNDFIDLFFSLLI